MCILELSTVLIYEFRYDYFKKKYGKKSKLLFTDTDSLIHEIKTEAFCESFSSNKEMFDLSNYPTQSKYDDKSNKLVLGKMKDETRGYVIKEFVGLKPKMYSFLVEDSEHKKARGVNKNVSTISHNEFYNVLLNDKCTRHSINRIQSKYYRIGTYEINKI